MHRIGWAMLVAAAAWTSLLVGCGAEPLEVSEAPDAGDAPTTDGDGTGRNPSAGDGGTTESRGEGGTVDAGPTDEPLTVCAGSKGDPAAVPLLSWSIYTGGGPKYKTILGAAWWLSQEPNSAVATILAANGTVSTSSGQSSTSIVGFGPFQSRSNVSKDGFVSHLMPRTEIALSRFGWSDYSQAVFDMGTIHAVNGWKVFRVAGTSSHVTGRTWSLADATRLPHPSEAPYVRSIQGTHGSGWLFAVVFDQSCKGAAFDKLVGDNALNILYPPTPVTRAQVSKFLVANNARFVLTAATPGAEDPNVKAALIGTQASAATLDTLESTMTAFTTAMKARSANLAVPQYGPVTNGTDPKWVIGQLESAPNEWLPPAP